MEEALLEALLPRSWRERFGRGYTAKEVFERLKPELQAFLRGEEEGVVAERRAIDTVYRRLMRMSEEGRIRRKTVGYWLLLNTKGYRNMVVDLFRR